MSYISREEENGITQSLLKELFTYKDGILYWKTLTERNRRVKIGDIAGTIKNQKNSYTIAINCKLYRGHRLIFLFNKGYLTEVIDHKDNDNSNNKIENLRSANHYTNQLNRKIGKDNTSGIKGVSMVHTGRWRARIKVKGKEISLGRFDTKEIAETAVIEARKIHHKEFANNG